MHQSPVKLLIMILWIVDTSTSSQPVLKSYCFKFLLENTAIDSVVSVKSGKNDKNDLNKTTALNHRYMIHKSTVYSSDYFIKI